MLLLDGRFCRELGRGDCAVVRGEVVVKAAAATVAIHDGDDLLIAERNYGLENCSLSALPDLCQRQRVTRAARGAVVADGKLIDSDRIVGVFR